MTRRWFAVGGILFLITLAVVIGLRMSSEAMAVVIGVIFGVAASIPASMLIVAVTWRREQRAANYPYHARRRSAHEALPPSVVIVNPNGSGPGNSYRQPAYLSAPDMQWGQAPRQFRVIGDPDEVSRDRGHAL